AAQWTAQRYYGGRYRIVPNGVDLSAARPDGARPHEELRIVFVGRAEERKGLPVLLRAFEALRGVGIPARLTVAGPTAEEVEPLLLDPEGIEIAGQVDDATKWKLLGEADLLCAPSLGGESFGMVLTRAFACALPVVASDITGYRDVMTDETGVLVPPGDPEALAAAVAALLEDEPRRERLGLAARRVAQERYSWDDIGRRLETIYRELA
ncbi:MAG: glycosyltransferase family 4 protein, partial [Gaiellaceae bacterium]